MSMLRRIVAPSAQRTSPKLLPAPTCAAGQRVQPYRGFHVSRRASSAKSLPLAKLKKDFGSKWPQMTLSTALLLENLRALQSKQFMQSKTDRAALYRDALRDLAAITLDKTEVRMGDVEEVLNPENGISWRAISELLRDGSVKAIREMSEEKRAACLFARVHGIGQVKADKFAKAGCRTLEDLESQELTKAQRIGLDHLDDMELKIPRSEIEAFDALFKSSLARSDPEFSHTIMGSYRRGNICSSDIDMVVWHPLYTKRHDDDQAKELMNKLKDTLYGAGILRVDKVMAAGHRKIMGLTRLPEALSAKLPPLEASLQGKKQDPEDAARPWRQVDIRLCPVPSLPYMLLGNTGDDTLMKILRYRAGERGWVLNEYGMGEREGDNTSTWVKSGTEIIVKHEREIFEKLEIPYLKPEERGYATYEKIWGKEFVF